MTKRLLRVLDGETVWPPPVWLMRQAGRYLPEYRAIRAKANNFVELCTTPELAAEITLQPVRRFAFDAAILFSDILIVPWALGYELAYREGEGPVLPPLRDASAVRSLDISRLPDAVSPVGAAVDRVLALLRVSHPEVALIGFAGAPFTVACYMIEGGGSKDFPAVRRMAYAEPELFQELMEILTQATIDYLTVQIKAGAEAVMLFDSWAGVLAPSLFRQHVTQPAQRIVHVLAERFSHVKAIGFPRLAGLMLGEYTQRTGVAAVGIDTSTDLALARRLVPPSVALQGNLDPLALAAGGLAMLDQTANILAAAHGHPFIFNLGHGVVPDTPPQHVARLLEYVRAS